MANGRGLKILLKIQLFLFFVLSASEHKRALAVWTEDLLAYGFVPGQGHFHFTHRTFKVSFVRSFVDQAPLLTEGSKRETLSSVNLFLSSPSGLQAGNFTDILHELFEPCVPIAFDEPYPILISADPTFYGGLYLSLLPDVLSGDHLPLPE